MTSCQLCGNETSSATKIKLEGTVLRVCKDCSDMGEKVKSPGRKRKKKKKTRTKRNRDNQKVLNPKFGEILKEAREEKGLTQDELAEKMNEKTSRISKMERSELKPDEKQAKKLRKELDVDLYVNPEVSNHGTRKNADSRSATLGDVAKMKD